MLNLTRIAIVGYLTLALIACTADTGNNAAVKNVAPADKLSGPKDKWQLTERKSPIDDSRTVVLHLDAENTIQGWPSKTVRPSLVIRCKEGKTDLYITTDMAANPQSGDSITVRLRLDSEPAMTQGWGESTSNDALFSPGSIQLARRLASTDTLLFEFTPFNSSPMLSRFDVRGLRTHLDVVSAACKWKVTQTTQTKREVKEAQPVPRNVQRIRDSSYVLAAHPYDFNGVPIPIPTGAELRPSDTPDTVTFFLITARSIRDFYEGAMDLEGWTSVAGDEPMLGKENKRYVVQSLRGFQSRQSD